MTNRPNGLTYMDAGVDIDAGEALVDAIKPLAKSTRRPGAEASLGGFGALFDLKAAGYDYPLIVTTTDGVGTKLKIAIETGRHDTVGIDLVAMCVNDLLAQGAEPLMFLDYFATSKLKVDEALFPELAFGYQIIGDPKINELAMTFTAGAKVAYISFPVSGVAGGGNVSMHL